MKRSAHSEVEVDDDVDDDWRYFDHGYATAEKLMAAREVPDPAAQRFASPTQPNAEAAGRSVCVQEQQHHAVEMDEDSGEEED